MKYVTLRRMIEVEIYKKGMEDGFMEESQVAMNPFQFNLMQSSAELRHGFMTYPYVVNNEAGTERREFIFEGCFIVTDVAGRYIVNEDQLELIAEPVSKV